MQNDGTITIGTCWDADRLDLGRVGVIPSVDFMSTHAGKKAACVGVVPQFNLTGNCIFFMIAQQSFGVRRVSAALEYLKALLTQRTPKDASRQKNPDEAG